jgi:hypothetical protein
MIEWEVQAKEFVNCNCAYGCPCQFNALPTHGDCHAIAAYDINKGHHGDVKLDGLKVVGIFSWPGAIHEAMEEPFLSSTNERVRRSAPPSSLFFPARTRSPAQRSGMCLRRPSPRCYLPNSNQLM